MVRLAPLAGQRYDHGACLVVDVVGLWLVKAYGLWVLFIGITLECMGIPVPGETVLVSAALYAGSTHRLRIGSVMLVAPPWPSVG